jgi:energy-coupling factor transport system ATP-binding protein
VLAAITRLVHDLGVTVVLAEHRLERVLPYADRVIYLAGDGTVADGSPGEILATADVRPPVIELGKLAGWDPLPLSVRDARRLAPRLRQQLPETPPRPCRPVHPGTGRTDHAGPPALTASGIVVRYGPLVAVRSASLTLRGGESTALMGRNGSGKSSLLWALQGTGSRSSGTLSVTASGADPARLAPAEARRLVGLVPQTPADLLYLDTVEAELAQADRDICDTPAATSARATLDQIAPGIPAEAHPRDLSAGQQLALVLAIQLAAAPAVILLDEPTRGLDYRAKASLIGVLDYLAARGHAVVVATHDVEFVTRACDRVIVMAEGEIVTDGQAAAVLTASPTFAPQIAKILSPLPYLTEAQVAAGLDRVTAS